MNRYFITGTDTDCGKTYVSCRLLAHWRDKNLQAQALKPVASGCVWQQGQWHSEDVLQLQAHNASPELAINRWQYDIAGAPHLLAEKAGERLSAKDINAFCQQPQFASFDKLLVEGAGGLMMPLNLQETWLDFLRLSGMPVIFVVGLRLGCISHALLSEAVLRQEGISCLGWIANKLKPELPMLEETIDTLTAMLSMPLLASLEPNGDTLSLTTHFDILLG